MINITEAWWFYKDKYCPPDLHPEKQTDYENKFFQRIFSEWSFLKPHLSIRNKLKEDCWNSYISRIPRYGCIIFNVQLDKVLFCVFHKQKGDVLKRNIVFPKGKVDEGENALDSALREV